MIRYYFDNMDMNRYPTLWDGFLHYSISNDLLTERNVYDIIIEICDIGFYINIHENNIYISLCRDSNYYYYDFEQHIKPIINKLESSLLINIELGEFNATEVKHQGNQYKYTILKNEDMTISLKKRILNWEKYDAKKVNIVNKMKHLTI